MRVMLFFPPQWTPAMPHLALPTLTAYLRPRGIEVIQRDLNIETYDTILTREYVEQSIARLREARRISSLPHALRDKVDWTLAEGPEFAARVEGAKTAMRSDAFFDGPSGVRAFLEISACLEIASLPFYPSSLDLLTYVPPADVDSSRHLLQTVRDPQRNIFLDVFRRIAVPDIVRTHPDVVGISIPTLAQMLPGMTLAHLIRQAGLGCHITVGGPHITMLREEIVKVPALFDLFDSAVLFDGEEPLLRIVEALDEHRDLSRIPNLVYRDGKQIRVTERVDSAVMARCGLSDGVKAEPARTGPDFDGLPLTRYLSPRLVLPLQSSRGCYHGKCAFCSVGYGEPATYRPLDAGDIVAQMLALKTKYGIQHIFFADEAISPRNLGDVSAKLERQGAPIHWCGCARFDRALSSELLERLAPGGCRMLLFGLETACEPVMRRMVKGTSLAETSRILGQSAGAGIWNHVFFFFGFPGETLDDAQQTLNFVYAHQPSIHSAAPGKFVLERHAPVHRSPETYGVKRINVHPQQDLAIYFDYETESGMNEETVDLALARFLDTLPTKRLGHFYANDAYRLLYASHLYERGLPFPPWLVAEVER